MDRGIRSYGLNLRSAHFSRSQGTSFSAKVSFLWKGLRCAAMLPFRDLNITESSIYKIWPCGQKLNYECCLDPLLCSTNQEIVVSPEGLVRPYPPNDCGEEGTADFCGCVTLLYWLIVCQALLDYPVGHFRSTSNKAKLAFRNRNSGMMQELGEECA
jgi:hypothetical protein